MNLYFEHPQRLLLLLLPLLWLLWYFLWYDRRRLTVSLSYNPAELMRLPRRWRWARLAAPMLQAAGLCLLAIAVARPRAIEGNLPSERQGADILLALDISASMETIDLAPNRLKVAQELLRELVRARPDDAFGLVVFAQEAFAYVPVTTDHAFVRGQLTEITTDLIPKEGTALGNAIAAGINRLKESSNSSKAMILLSDGVHNVGAFDPLNAAHTAARNGVPIFAIGVGSVMKLPTGDKYSTSDSTDFDERTLRQMAQISGGKYYHAANEQTLESLMLDLNELDGSGKNEIIFNRMYDRYHIFIAAALGCWLLAFALARLRWFNFLEG